MATNGKTIKQIAEELGVSKQAVHQKRKSKGLSTDLQSFTTTVDGVVYISVDGEMIIKQAFAVNDRKRVNDNETLTVDASFSTPADSQNELYAILKDELSSLREQLAVKDRQISELTATVKTQAESINADRQNQLAGTLIEGRQMIEGGAESVEQETPRRKPGIFARIFGKE